MSTLSFAYFVLLGYMSFLFAVAVVRKNNGIADIGYGIAFIMLVSTMFSLSRADSLPYQIVVGLVSLWGIRLAIRIGYKNFGKPEDFRYKAWRDSWGDSFLWRSFLQIYMLQGTIVFVVALPVTLALAYPASGTSLAFFYIGMVIWIIGFAFEAIGDYQLDRFIRNPSNKGTIMMTGLWHYTRHPNYFGESVMWWGLAIAGISLSSVWPIGFLGPILITYLLRYVSGVPLLEKRWAGNPQWEAYTAVTPAMIPSFGKRITR